jgi:hypothetical protein
MPGLGLTVGGAGDFAKLGAALHRAARTDLAQELDRGMRRAARTVERVIRRDVDDYMPRGYEEVFKASLHFKTEVKQVAGRLTVVVYAVGAKGGRRQVEQLERGEFRAPNWGRWRTRRGVNRGRHKIRQKWHTQRVRPHFATEPAEGATPQVREKIDAAIKRVVDKIERA